MATKLKPINDLGNITDILHKNQRIWTCQEQLKINYLKEISTLLPELINIVLEYSELKVFRVNDNWDDKPFRDINDPFEGNFVDDSERWTVSDLDQMDSKTFDEY